MAQLKVIIIDHTGARKTPVELPDDAPMRRLIPALVMKMGFPTTQGGQPLSYALDHRASGRRLHDEDTMTSAGVQADDELVLLPQVTAGGGVPIRSFEQIQLVEAVMRDGKLINAVDGRVLFAVFLYTDEDMSLASYVRHHIRELHEMSDWHCMFFVIEQPSSEWTTDVRQYLGSLADKYFDVIWERLGVDSFKPFDKVRAYEIARHFEVEPRQLPCIIFFTELKSSDVLVVEFNRFLDASQATATVYTDFFRGLFSYTRTAVSSGPDQALKELSELLRADSRRQGKKGNGSMELRKLAAPLIEVIAALVKAFLT
jgi:hypothetical protein